MPVTKENVEDVFTYRAPEGDQPTRYATLRVAARVFVETILENTPVCADQIMTANAAIALKGSI